MRNFARWILYHEYPLCDSWGDYFLGIYKAEGDEVAGFATKGVEVI